MKSRYQPYFRVLLFHHFRSILSGFLFIGILFIISRGLIRLLPGDPIETLFAEAGINVPVEELRTELGLNRPLLISVWEDVKGWIRGDFGRTLHSREPIADLIAPRLVHTTALATLSLFIGVFLSLTLGAVAGQGRKGLQRLIDLWAAIFSALPLTVVAPGMLYLQFILGTSRADLAGEPSNGLLSSAILLPSLTLALFWIGIWSRLVAQSVASELKWGASLGARARGLSEIRILWAYGVRPVLPTLLAQWGTHFGQLLGGTIIIESVFNWPGLGSLFLDSVLKRDYPLIEVCLFWMACTAWIGTKLGDQLQKLTDPRIQGDSST